MEKMHKVEVVTPETDSEGVIDAMFTLICHAHNGGCRRPGEAMTVVVPPAEVTTRGGQVQETGTWEISVKRIEDR